MKANTRKQYAIYLPNDTEKWFGITFSKVSRAKWFAEIHSLESHEYEIRPDGSKPTVAQTQPTDTKEVA